MRYLLLMYLATCGGQASEPPSSPDPEEERADAAEPNELARALMRLQDPELTQEQRNDAMRDFVDLFLRAEVFVPASGPVAVGDRSGASALECFTDAESVEVRHPGSEPRAVDARDVLGQARDSKYGVVLRYEAKSRSYDTGFPPAQAAHLLDL